MKPTLYLTNWSSHRTPGCHGRGRKLTIMAAPRKWEKGGGTVVVLTPNVHDLRAVQDQHISGAEYRERFERMVGKLNEAGKLAPGELLTFEGFGVGELVLDGDTLCCACSRAEAAAGRCHRVWAAKALAAAGWNIILDGEPLEHA